MQLRNRSSMFPALGVVLLTIIFELILSQILTPGSWTLPLVIDHLGLSAPKAAITPHQISIQHLENQVSQLKRLLALKNLMPDSFIPIQISVVNNKDGELSYVGYLQKPLNRGSFVLLGTHGIAGRAQKHHKGFYEIKPLTSTGMKWALIGDDSRADPLLFEGKNKKLIATTKSTVLKVGSTLFTLGCDPYSPKNYPIAKVISIQTEGMEYVVEAEPLQQLHQQEVFLLFYPNDGGEEK